MEEKIKNDELVFDDREIEDLSDTPMKTPSLEEEKQLVNEINDMFKNWKNRYESSTKEQESKYDFRRI